jgi:hypothetical protein
VVQARGQSERRRQDAVIARLTSSRTAQGRRRAPLALPTPALDS